MKDCPSCGREIPREDIRPGGFRCPWCKEHLRGALRGGRIGVTAILLLTCSLFHAAGVSVANIFLLGPAVTFLIAVVWHSLTDFYWPRFEKDPTMRDDFPHIVLPPDRSNKSKSGSLRGIRPPTDSSAVLNMITSTYVLIPG